MTVKAAPIIDPDSYLDEEEKIHKIQAALEATLLEHEPSLQQGSPRTIIIATVAIADFLGAIMAAAIIGGSQDSYEALLNTAILRMKRSAKSNAAYNMAANEAEDVKVTIN